MYLVNHVSTEALNALRMIHPGTILFVRFPLVIVLSVLLRFTALDYPIGIFKLVYKSF